MDPTFLQGVILQAVGKHQDHSNYMQNKQWFLHYWLVVFTILKNMKVNWKDYPIYEMEK